MARRNAVSLAFAGLILLVIIPLATVAVFRANAESDADTAHNKSITRTQVTLAGIFTTQFETSSFVPCEPHDWREAWLAADDPDFYPRLAKGARDAGVPDFSQHSFFTFVLAEGRLEVSDSPLMRFGHMN